MGVMAEAAQFKQGTSYPRFFESVTATPGSLARQSESESPTLLRPQGLAATELRLPTGLRA